VWALALGTARGTTTEEGTMMGLEVRG